MALFGATAGLSLNVASTVALSTRNGGEENTKDDS